MNRAERRRQGKKAKKAAKNSKPEQATNRSAGQQALAIKQSLQLAVQHHNSGELAKAEGIYQQILQTDPNQPDALHLLGVIYSQVGKHDVSVEFITKALAIEPNLAEAHSNLGLALRELGKLDEAVASYHKVLGLKPDFAEAHSNLGLALMDLGKLDEAVASYHKALAINPDYAKAHGNLGLALQDLGALEDAFASQRRSIALNPRNELFWSALAGCLEVLPIIPVVDDLFQDLMQLLERPSVRPSFLVRPIISTLCHHHDFSRILEATGSAKPEVEIAYADFAEKLSQIPLFLRIMGLSHINDLKIERMLTVLRRAMLTETLAGNRDEKGLPFAAALALQCFANEYVFPETDEEMEAVENLHRQIASLVEEEFEVPPSLVATLGAYRLLSGFPWAGELSGREWAGDMAEVIKLQISEPLQEQSLRSQIPQLTAIQDTVSQSVREQYEENPYPRWIKTEIGDKGRAMGAILLGSPLRFDLGDYQFPESPEILVAGCGTGQHALITASRFSNARVLAVDLSLSSLSYAMRKTQELNFSNIEYAQADIMELGSLERRFDHIESVGVLHHLDDPLAGWRNLVTLLRPGGLMMIGLYSEIVRQDIIAARALIAEKGYTSSPEDIRRCRRDIIDMAEGGNPEMARVSKRKDFFSLNDCRDLIFHVQEHRFTLLQIEDALEALDLQFLGFEMRDSGTLRMFTESHPEKGAPTSLTLWHEFELNNPDTFRGLYHLWCKKK